MPYQITFGPIRAWNIKYTHLLKYPQEVNEPKQGRQSKEREREGERREGVGHFKIWLKCLTNSRTPQRTIRAQ